MADTPSSLDIPMPLDTCRVLYTDVRLKKKEK